MAERIVIALSGGVDSAVAALLLRDAGHHVHAVYMKNWINEDNAFGDCPWMQDIKDARAVSEHLGISFEVVNFMRDYRQRIVDYLVDGYARGITPNPDVMCNREMKFGVLLDWALERGFDAVATGHYSRRVPAADAPSAFGHQWHTDPDCPWAVLEGVDDNKDQSYFLSRMLPRQVAHARFPIGHLRKPELRALAHEAGLPNAAKKDSQGICFIGQVKINDFLEHFIPEKPGPIINTEGKVLGQHKGLHRYTLGQRRGIGIPSNTDNQFYVVVGKRAEDNALLVAFESPTTPGLWQTHTTLHSLSWIISNPPQRRMRLLCKVRYRDPSVGVQVEPGPGDSLLLHFDEPQRALASGQICALYDGPRLLGSGIYL